MTHSAKDCLERPRKVGARFTGKNIAADEIIHDSTKGMNFLQGQGDWDVKRDRWDGYDPASHRQVVEEHDALEAARRKLREEAIDKGTAEAGSKALEKAAKKGKSGKGKGKGKRDEAADDDSDEFGTDSDDDGHGGGAGSGSDDEDKYAEGADVAGQKLDTKTRVTVRNLRIREDTAKYLLNLDTDSAYYDPKTRSMREAPLPTTDLEDVRPLPRTICSCHLVRPDTDPRSPPLVQAKFAGENFVRHSGGATDLQKLQLFAWQSEQRGHDVHITSNPTAAALMHKEFLAQKEVLKGKSSASILDKYGGEQYLQSVPKELRAGQTENYVEYDRRGKVVKGIERAKARSKYDEDSALQPFSRATLARCSLCPAECWCSGTEQILMALISPCSLPGQPSVDLGLVVPAHDGQMGLRVLPLDDQGVVLRCVSTSRSFRFAAHCARVC